MINDLTNDICILEKLIKEIEYARNNMKTPPLKLFGIENYLKEQEENENMKYIRKYELNKMLEEARFFKKNVNDNTITLVYNDNLYLLSKVRFNYKVVQEMPFINPSIKKLLDNLIQGYEESINNYLILNDDGLYDKTINNLKERREAIKEIVKIYDEELEILNKN